MHLMTSQFLNRTFVVYLYLLFASASFAQVQAQGTAQSIIISETAYNMDSGDSRGKLWWVVVMKNPNENFFARRPEIRITAKSRDGHILAVKDKNFPEI